MNNTPTPQFTTPCFIDANTPALRLALKKLGYEPSQTFVCTEKAIWLSGHRYYSTDNVFVTSSFPIGEIDLPYGRYCCDSMNLFLAIAALREDSDIHQWFTTDDCSEWYLCNTDTCGKKVESVNRWHKATPEELIEYFTKQ